MDAESREWLVTVNKLRLRVSGHCPVFPVNCGWSVPNKDLSDPVILFRASSLLFMVLTLAYSIKIEKVFDKRNNFNLQLVYFKLTKSLFYMTPRRPSGIIGGLCAVRSHGLRARFPAVCLVFFLFSTYFYLCMVQVHGPWSNTLIAGATLRLTDI